MSLYLLLVLALGWWMEQAINKRKTPRQERSQATVAAILQACAHILVESGHVALSTNKIAERAGVSIGSLYQYFPNKDAIMSELIRQKRERLLKGVDKALADNESETFEMALEAVLAAIIKQQLNWPKLAMALDQTEAFLLLSTETLNFKSTLYSKIEHLIRSNGLAISDRATQDIIAISKGMIMHAGLASETDEIDLRKRVLKAVIGYLGI